jgi:hypothetical protein
MRPVAALPRLALAAALPASRPRRHRAPSRRRAALAPSAAAADEETDVVVIGARAAPACAACRACSTRGASALAHAFTPLHAGAGIGGLCAGALLAHYGLRVVVLESHDCAGGAAHAWERDGFTFESGPSLYSAMAARPSGNPIAQVGSCALCASVRHSG